MSWFDDWWRKKGKKFRSIDDFDALFDEIFKEVEMIFSRMGFGEPIIRGFSITIGPDGKPVFREIGPRRTVKEVDMEREEEKEVYVDIIDEKDHYLILADMPGVDEDKIEVYTRDNKLIIKGKGINAYYKVVNLPKNASGKIREWKYEHGILKVKIGKKKLLGGLL